MFQYIIVLQVEMNKKQYSFLIISIKKSSSANSIILNLIPFERIKPRSFRVYQNSSVSFSFFKQKILDALVLTLEGRKSHRESRGQLGNDIFQFGSISPIIILILNFSPAHSKKNHQKPSFLPRRVKKPIRRVGASQAMTYFNLDLIVQF